MKKRIFIVQNTELGSARPLSVFLTGLLSNILATGDLEFHLVVSKSQEIPQKVRRLCRSIHEVNVSLYSVIGNLRFTLEAARVLTKAHRDRSIQIVHCLYPNSSLLAAVLFSRFRRFAPALLYDVRSPWIEMIFARQHLGKVARLLVRRLLFALERWLVRQVDHLVLITDGLREYYCEHFGLRNQPYTIIPTAVDPTRFNPEGPDQRQALGFDPGARVIGYVGTMDFSRQLGQFLAEFIRVAQDQPQLHLVFLGEGNAREQLQYESATSPVGKQIHFLGRVAHEEVPAYIRAFDYGLCHLPPGFVYDHSFPLKVLEYLACGVPVLASNIKAHQQIAKVLQGLDLYADAGDLVEILERSDPLKVDEDIQAFSWSVVANQYTDLYRSL